MTDLRFRQCRDLRAISASSGTLASLEGNLLRREDARERLEGISSVGAGTVVLLIGLSRPGGRPVPVIEVRFFRFVSSLFFWLTDRRRPRVDASREIRRIFSATSVVEDPSSSPPRPPILSSPQSYPTFRTRKLLLRAAWRIEFLRRLNIVTEETFDFPR